MATVNPYEAPQSVELISPFKLPLTQQQECEIIATGCRLIKYSVVGAFVGLVLSAIAVALLKEILPETETTLLIRSASTLIVPAAILYVILYFASVISMCRLQPISPGYSTIRDALVALIAVPCLAVAAWYYQANDDFQFNRALDYICIHVVILAFVFHCYKMLCFQSDIASWIKNSNLQSTTSTTKLLLILCFLCYLCFCFFKNDILRLCIYIGIIPCLIIGTASYFAGFSHIQKLIAAQLSNSTTSDHQQ